MLFDEKLRTLRKRSGLSQEELAARLDVSRQAVSKWESGQGYPETEKLLRLSSLFGVSLDYLLKDEGGAEEDHCATEREEGGQGLYVSREMAQGFLTERRRGARRIALGVAILIIGVALFMFFNGGPESLGMLLFFCTEALGVGVLIWQGFQPKQYQQLERQGLFFDPAVLEELRQEAIQARRRSGNMVLAGAMLCIVSFGAIFFLSQYLGMANGISTAFAFAMIALGVSLFIMAGSDMSAYDLLTRNGRHRQEADKESRHGWIFGLFMPLAALVFVGLGLAFRVWHIAWIIFPVTAICCSGYVNYKDSQENE